MAFSKAQKYPHILQGVANISKCLGHPARIQILRDLVQGPKTTFEMSLDHPLCHQAISRHCQVLLNNGIVYSAVFGNRTRYFIVHSEIPTLVWEILKQTGNAENERFMPSEKENLQIV